MDENFNEIEQPRKESLNPYRDQVIEEIAQHIERMSGFGHDTLHSFAVYIRSLK
jgi:hypothetical protein